VVVLDFWATWCGPCRRGLPVIVEVTSALRDRGVVFYSVNQRETNEQVTEFLGKQEYTMNVLMDREGKVGDLFGVSGIPHTVIIGKDGKIADVHVGFAPGLKEELTEKLNEILDESH
ncbi:MAG: TlpA family protein disulfide reductase, partial [Phycisphaerales bacterium]|nr:TlpA family protein disulfide reductase [Phycisphaerales bacterium]